jgi:hypothetical protein
MGMCTLSSLKTNFLSIYFVANPFDKVKKEIKVGETSYSFYNLADLKDARLGMLRVYLDKKQKKRKERKRRKEKRTTETKHEQLARVHCALLTNTH